MICHQACFELTRVKKYSVLGYSHTGFLDHLGILRFTPGNTRITRV